MIQFLSPAAEIILRFASTATKLAGALTPIAAENKSNIQHDQLEDLEPSEQHNAYARASIRL